MNGRSDHEMLRPVAGCRQPPNTTKHDNLRLFEAGYGTPHARTR